MQLILNIIEVILIISLRAKQKNNNKKMRKKERKEWKWKGSKLRLIVNYWIDIMNLNELTRQAKDWI